jgi:predicted nuclease of predicted toxin-antitoxin system
VKLLLDQNLSRKLVPHLQRPYPGSSHVYLLGFHKWADSEIWRYAHHNGFTIATKNNDMVDLCVLRGTPPKVLWLRVGNCTTKLILDVLTMNEEPHSSVP